MVLRVKHTELPTFQILLHNAQFTGCDLLFCKSEMTPLIELLVMSTYRGTTSTRH